MVASAIGSATMEGAGISMLLDNALSDTCRLVTVMQSPSLGQQFISAGVIRNTFPEHAHLVKLIPPPHIINIISAVSVAAMFVKCLISNCKGIHFF